MRTAAKGQLANRVQPMRLSAEKVAVLQGEITQIWTSRQLFLYSTKTYKNNIKRYPVTHIYARIGKVDPVVRILHGGNMKEKIIEQILIRAAKDMGGIAPKLMSPGFDGMPDRIVLLPGGRMGFVEVKVPGKVPRPLQEARHRMLRNLGFKVFVLDGADQIGGILDAIYAP